MPAAYILVRLCAEAFLTNLLLLDVGWGFGCSSVPVGGGGGDAPAEADATESTTMGTGEEVMTERLDA